MANVVIMPREEKVNRGAMIGAALAQGFGNISQMLLTIAARKEERELQERQLDAELLAQHERSVAARDRMESLKQYRNDMLEMQRQGQLNNQEYRQAKLAADADRNAWRKEVEGARLGMERTRLDLARVRAAGGGGSRGSKPPKPTETQMVVEDYERVRRGLKPKFYKGADLGYLEKLKTKKAALTPWQEMTMPSQAAPAPVPPVAPPTDRPAVPILPGAAEYLRSIGR